jgi:hypothetical protein
VKSLAAGLTLLQNRPGGLYEGHTYTVPPQSHILSETSQMRTCLGERTMKSMVRVSWKSNRPLMTPTLVTDATCTCGL